MGNTGTEDCAYPTCNSEQHILTPKYDILHSLVTLVKYYHVIEMDYDDKPFKNKFHHCNGYLICDGKL